MKKISLVVTALLSVASAISGLAANITVASAADSGEGSLREAVEKAATDDVITFDIPKKGTGYDPAADTWAITLTNGEIKISKRLTVKGDGKIILDGNNASRIFSHDTSSDVVNALTLDGLTFRNGWATGDGGAVLMRGRIDATGCTFTGNKARSGGAMYALGTVTITGCTFIANSAVSGGGAVNARYGRVNATGCAFTRNTTDTDGGAVYADKGAVAVEGCSFTGNIANGCGGAVYADKGSVTAEICSFTGNTANNGSGGAVWAETAFSAKTCAFSGNKAVNGSGGAVHADGTATAEGSTFTGNKAESGSAVRASGLVSAANSSFAENCAGSGHSGAIHADRSAYLYHVTVVNSTGAGVYLCVDPSKAKPRLYAYNSVIAGNSADIQAGFGNGDGITAVPPESIIGSSLIEGATAGVSYATVFGVNTPGKDGVVFPRVGGRADKTASALRAAGLKVLPGVKSAEVIACLGQDISGTSRPATGKVSYGAKE